MGNKQSNMSKSVDKKEKFAIGDCSGCKLNLYIHGAILLIIIVLVMWYYRKQ